MTANIVVPEGTLELLPSGGESSFEPMDEFNKTLLENVHPSDYVNPVPSEDYDLVVIGAGVAGLLSVITGKWLGKRCALIESSAMGGDCLNVGCVPSKVLLASARALSEVRSSAKFGVILPEGAIKIDFDFVMKRMRRIRAEIAPHDSVHRYSREFCEHVFIGHGKFSSPNTNCIEVTGDDGSLRILRYKKAMIATGASPFVPPSLVSVPHLTNSNFFNLTEMPPRMIVLGSGPIGLELSQAMSVFGCNVVCIERSEKVLPREDPDAAQIIMNQLQADGRWWMEKSTVYLFLWQNTYTVKLKKSNCDHIINFQSISS